MGLKKIILIVLTVAIFTALITPLVKKIAFHIKAVDKPNKRKIHTKVIPCLGGLAIFFGFLFGYMIFARPTTQMIAILIGGFIILILGIMDDINPINYKIKLIGQTFAALVIVFYGNIILEHVNLFGLIIPFGILKYLITIIFIIAITNSINLIDGLDGLAAGISSIYFLTIGIIAFLTGKINGLEVVLAFIMLGSSLGFLFHNFYPANIFMGDSGSMFLGFIISIIALLGFKNITLTSLIIPGLLLASPLLDSILAFFRRKLQGKSFSTPDKLHFHHQLLEMNLGHKNTVILIYLINSLFAFASIICTLNDQKVGKILYATLIIGTVIFILKTNILFDKKRKKK